MENVSVLERELARVADVAFGAVDATVTRVFRVVGFVSTALVRAARELSDLAWDYQDLAGELRRAEREAAADCGRPQLRLLVSRPSA